MNDECMRVAIDTIGSSTNVLEPILLSQRQRTPGVVSERLLYQPPLACPACI